MRRIFTSALALYALSALAHAADSEVPQMEPNAEELGEFQETIDEIEPAEFYSNIKKREDGTMVGFYSGEAMGYSEQMLALQEAATHMQLKGLGMENFARVNYEHEEDVHKKKFKIRKDGITLRWYVNGSAKPYKGGTTAEELVLFVLEQTDNLHKDIECSKIKEADSPVYHLNSVYVGDVDRKSETYNHFIKTHTNTLEPYQYIQTGSECADHFGIKAPGVVIYRNFDEKWTHFTGNSHTELSSLMSNLAIPTFSEWLVSQTHPFFTKRQTVQITFLITNEGSKVDQPLLEIFEKAAKSKDPSFNKDTRFAIQTKDDDGRAALFGELGLDSKTQLPLIVGIVPNQKGSVLSKKYHLSHAGITEKDIIKFVTDCKEGNIERFYKSQPIQDEVIASVHQVNGESFDRIVRDPTKDVMVNIADYQNKFQLGISKEFQTFAKVFTDDVPNLIFAEIDLSTNDIKGIEYEKIPTRALFPKEGEFSHTGFEVANANSMLDDATDSSESAISFIQTLTHHSKVYKEFCDTDKGSKLCGQHLIKLIALTSMDAGTGQKDSQDQLNNLEEVFDAGNSAEQEAQNEKEDNIVDKEIEKAELGEQEVVDLDGGQKSEL